MQYRAVMGVSSLPVVGAKMAFSVCTVKNDRNRHKNDVICGPSLCFVSHICSESAIFATTTDRLDTALTAVYGISSEKYLSSILIWSSILAN